MWPNPQFSADLVTFTEEILDGKLDFLSSKKLAFRKLGARWLKNLKTSWSPITFQRKFLYIENLRHSKTPDTPVFWPENKMSFILCFIYVFSLPDHPSYVCLTCYNYINHWFLYIYFTTIYNINRFSYIYFEWQM